MAVTHGRLSKLEREVGISSNQMFVFEVPGSRNDDPQTSDTTPDGGVSDADFLRLVGRPKCESDLIIALRVFCDPLVEVKLLSMKDLS